MSDYFQHAIDGAILTTLAPAPVEVIGVLGDVRHEISPHRSMHRLVHISGASGDWAGYTMVAVLDIEGNDGVVRGRYIGTTGYYRGVLPAIAKFEQWKDHASA